MVVAPLVAQLSVLLAPEFRLVGFAVKDVIEGTEPVAWVVSDEVAMPAQLVRPTQANRMKPSAEALHA